jgi:hypothetical protein
MELSPAPGAEALVLPAYLPAFLQLRVPVHSPSAQRGTQVVQVWSNMPEAPTPSSTAAGAQQPWEVPVALQPFCRVGHGRRLQLHRSTLRIAPAGDEAGAFQHFQVLRDGRQADIERFGKFIHRHLAERQPRQNGPARRISER